MEHADALTLGWPDMAVICQACDEAASGDGGRAARMVRGRTAIVSQSCITHHAPRSTAGHGAWSEAWRVADVASALGPSQTGTDGDKRLVWGTGLGGLPGSAPAAAELSSARVDPAVP